MVHSGFNSYATILFKWRQRSEATGEYMVEFWMNCLALVQNILMHYWIQESILGYSLYEKHKKINPYVKKLNCATQHPWDYFNVWWVHKQTKVK